MSILTAYDKFIQQALKYGFSLWGTAKTGQKTSYRTGDDGDLEKGYPKTPPRFKDNGDGTITDNATGLMWVKDPSQLGGVWGTPGSPSQMTWNNAIDNCLALDYAGHSDWRLPNIKEIMSIVDYSKFYPSIDETFFPNNPAGYYWSSTTYTNNTSYAWYMDFYGSVVSNDTKIRPLYVYPVRLGVPKD